MKKPIRGQNWTERTESTIFTSLNQLSSWPQKNRRLFTGDVYATTESVKCLVQTRWWFRIYVGLRIVRVQIGRTFAAFSFYWVVGGFWILKKTNTGTLMETKCMPGLNCREPLKWCLSNVAKGFSRCSSECLLMFFFHLSCRLVTFPNNSC